MGNAALTAKVARTFDKVRTRLFGDVSEVLLLKDSPDSERAWETVATIDKAWFFGYDKFRRAFLIEIAADGLNLTEWMAEATHVQIDEDVYEIARADTLPPKGTDVTWKIYCDRTARRGIYRGL